MIKEAYILAGGKSSRMGEDKGLKELKGAPLLAYTLNTLSNYFPTIKINTENKKYNQFGKPLVSDIIPEKGPMGGIYTSLKDSLGDIFIISCDMPLITEKIIQILLNKHRKGNITVASYKNRIQPLLGIYTKNKVLLLEEKIKKNQLKMQYFLQDAKAEIIEMEKITSSEVFMNINTPDEFNKVQNLRK